MKTNKSFTKRLKFTKNGKLKALAKGRNHYNAKESASEKAAKKKKFDFSIVKKVRSRVLPKK